MTTGHALVTGGAGFIGSHLCDRLIRDGYEVVCVDNLVTGALANMGHLRSGPRFSFVKADVTQPLELEGPVDLLFHFASPASPKDYAAHQIETLDVGSRGTRSLLELAREKGARFVLASSSEVYGDAQVSPQTESYWGHVNPLGPRSVYDEAKRFAEALTMAYLRTHGLDVRIARIFNTYGPRMKVSDGRAVPNFVVQALRGEPLTVYGDGSQTRSLCHVEDLVEGVMRLALEERLPGDLPAVNLGNPEEVTIRRLAEEVIDITGTRSTIEFRPLPQDDPKVRRPDIRRAEALFGWRPRVKRAEGLPTVVEYFANRLALNKPDGLAEALRPQGAALRAGQISRDQRMETIDGED